jgi:hypothetical protein
VRQRKEKPKLDFTYRSQADCAALRGGAAPEAVVNLGSSVLFRRFAVEIFETDFLYRLNLISPLDNPASLISGVSSYVISHYRT